uniref:Uncharacterized protein n=1 Tax=Alexandrium monilatum TaxID=311494 RepID=A0A7S4QDB5_9DINO
MASPGDCGQVSSEQSSPAEEERRRDDGAARLRDALLRPQGVRFEMPNASFAALFGRPCSSGGGTADVSGADEVRALLGEDCAAASVVASLSVRHDGAGFAEISTKTAAGQSSLERSLASGGQPSAQSRAAAAAAAAAVASRASAFVIDSDSEEEVPKQPSAKRLCSGP